MEMRTVEKDPAIIARMQALVGSWQERGDQRAVFLSCYQMMTQNMLTAIERGEFRDSLWIGRLLHDFADYYFKALEQYDRNPTSTPRVWYIAHDAARDSKSMALQNLLLGVNAHINYDLVLTLDDLLHSEWQRLSPEKQADRYWDYCYVNDIIGKTIDAVQDQVLEPAMPILDIFDSLLGRHDETLVSNLITHWRENVWKQAVCLFDCDNPQERTSLIVNVEKNALRHASVIGLGRFL
jgi:hypothetical protein